MSVALLLFAAVRLTSGRIQVTEKPMDAFTARA